MGVLEGAAAISADLEDWWRNYEEWEIALDEVVDFGLGVVLSISKQVGSLPGASERLRRNNADVWRFADRRVVRWTAYADVDDARAAAERLAEERGWAVPEEPTTPDLVARVRDLFVSASRGDVDAMASFFAPDAVWDNSRHGLEIVEGLAAVRRLIEEWFAAYEGLEFEPEEIVDLGNGVVFAVFSQHARLAGSTAEVRLRQPAVAIWADGLAVRLTMYPESDIEEARATAERLAEERE